jgi:thiol-disulfide isomerase/thioredoxin
MKFDALFSKLVLALLISTLGASVGCKSEQTEPAEASKQPEASKQDDPAKPEEPTEQAPEPKPADEVSTVMGDGDLVGLVSREMIENQREDWKEAIAQATVDEKAAKALAEVEPGARVTIYFGAWCEDCRRELPRFFKALDAAGEVPFTYELVGVDKYFQADEVSQVPLDLPAIPTFVVDRDGQVVGSVVEKAPNGIEQDLLSLLSGEKTGVLSATR